MNYHYSQKRTLLRSGRQWWAGPAAFFASMLALPVNAGVAIPDDPLTTAARVAPNILFILDDSGSMSFDYMPDSVPKTSTPDVSALAYTRNSLSYNPAVTYQPWLKADGNRMGSTAYSAVYGSFNRVGGTVIDLGNPKSCRYFNRNTNATTDEPSGTSGTQVCGGVQTFYVPKDPSQTGAAYLGDGANYYRYQILESGSIYRSEYLAYSSTNTPATAASMGCASSSKGSDWRGCVAWSSAWTGRSEAGEKANYANWFSFHRTRIKAAKAGASEAFGVLGGGVRVGFRTIWGRGANHAKPIPVTDGNDGRFVNNVADSKTGAVSTVSRTQWYDSLQSVIGYNGTPLHGALYSAGEYFKGDASDGAYGPQKKAAQLTCRQNFAILTTDGYWNDTSTNYVSVGEQDDADGRVIKDPRGRAYTYNTASDRRWPYVGTDSNTLADVAMKYWKEDLRDDMDNNVPSSDADPAFWQHMVTFGISIGLSGTRGWTSVEDVKNAKTNLSWPNPNKTEDATRIDDLLHAAVNGHGQFVAASSPAEFTAGLSQALAAISQRTGSFSNVSTNSTSLDTGSRVFSASYISGTWTGQVKGQPVNRSGVSGDGWTSSIPAFASRKVFTSNGRAGVNFPTAAQQALLTRLGGPADYAVTGADNANYIKGDASKEERNGGLLRNRPSTVLGDIVGSSPAYVKDTDTLYVGANDGMLHAFDASSGRELFAYVPGIVNFGNLATLSRGDYAHKFLVDGPLVASSRALTPDKNILVGALGKGGKGLYALNVTAPGAATATGVGMWELAETPRSNMGLVLGRPIMSRVQGTSAAAVVVGNGINSANDSAVLLVINAETGAVIREIDTGEGSATAPNGLSAPAGVYGADGKTLAYVYAGDMLGNVWKFDLSSSSSAQWTAKKLFTAQDAKGNAQPISSGVTVATHPLTGKRWIFFGTGRYLTEGDAGSDSVAVQGMYGFLEDEAAQSSAGLSRTALTQRVVKITAATQNGYSVRAFEANAALPSGSKGWYVDLPDSGERIVQDAQVVSTYLVTASMVPTGNACDPDGRGYINALDAFTGTSALGSYFDLDNNPATDDKVGDLPVGSVDAGVGMPTLPDLLRGLTLLGGSNGEIVGLRTLSPRWDRVSWRELRKEQ